MTQRVQIQLLWFMVIILTSSMGYQWYAGAGTQKVAFVNTPVLLSKYKGMQQAQKQIEQELAGYQANLDTLQSEIQQAMQRFEKTRATMSKKEQDLSRQLLQTKQQQFGQYQQAIQQKAQEVQGKGHQAVAEKINAYIKEYGEKHGYKMILGATAAGNILYGDEAIDLTEIMVKELNEKK